MRLSLFPPDLILKGASITVFHQYVQLLTMGAFRPPDIVELDYVWMKELLHNGYFSKRGLDVCIGQVLKVNDFESKNLAICGILNHMNDSKRTITQDLDILVLRSSLSRKVLLLFRL